MTPAPTTNQAPHGRWYASASFWTGPFTSGVAVLVAVGIGVAWHILGGFPRDHDKYGTVPVPGQRVLHLPKGDVRVNFENDTTGSGDTRSLQHRPRALAIRVAPADGGQEIEVTRLPSWLYSSISNDRGHEPFGKLEIPSAGSYRIRVTDDDADGLGSPATSRRASPTGSGPKITLGQRPWTPLNSALLGAILAGLAVFLAALLLRLPVRLIS
jgi:hypothetical protein